MASAFATPAPLRGTLPVHNIARTAPAVSPRRVVHLSVSTPRSTPRHSAPGRRSKRDPTFRKLQRRHRQGPATFRRAQEKEAAGAEEGAVAEGGGGGGGSGGATKGPSTRVVVMPRVRRPRFRADGVPLSELTIGQEMAGVAQNSKPYGVYVDVGATVDGLVHVRDMAIDFVHEPDDLVRQGDSVTVWVKYVDAAANVLGLSMLPPPPPGTGPGFAIAERTALPDLPVGGRVRGFVRRITNFGAYVDIGATRPGFIHVTALWGDRPHDTLDGLRLGTKVWVHIAHVDLANSHIVLRARAQGGAMLDEHAKLEQPRSSHVRGWLADDEPRMLSELPLRPSTKVAIQRPGEELVDEDEDDESRGRDGHITADVLDDDEDDDNSTAAVESAKNDSNLVEKDDDEDDDEFAFANDIQTLQAGGKSILEEGEDDEDDDDEDEFAFANEYEGGTTLGKLTGLIDSETELVGFEEGDDLLNYLRTKQARNKERAAAEASGMGAMGMENEDEEDVEDEEEEDEAYLDDDGDEDEYTNDVDDGDSGKDLASLLHGNIDF